METSTLYIDHEEKMDEIERPIGVTNLLIACQRRDLPAVTSLLSQNVTVNTTDPAGKTVLHHACSPIWAYHMNDHLPIIKILLQSGAASTPDRFGLTPIKEAGLWGHSDIVNFFLEDSSIPTLDKIDALELLGANRQKYASRISIESRREIWLQSLSMRGKEFPKEGFNCLRAFGLPDEFKTEQDIYELQDDSQQFDLQSIQVYCRVLGFTHLRTANEIIREVTKENSKFSLRKRLALTSHLLSFKEDLLRNLDFVNFRKGREDMLNIRDLIFFFMKHSKGMKIKHLLQLYDLVALYLHKQSQNIVVDDSYDDVQKFPSRNINTKTLMELSFSFMSWIQASVFKTMSRNENKARFRNITITMLCMQNRKGQEWSLMHKLTRSFIKCKYAEEGLEYILQCGADPNETDRFGNTLLHTIEKMARDELDKDRLPIYTKLAVVLLKYGIHHDSRNKRNEVVNIKKLVPEVDLMQYTTLQCLACRTIKQHELKYNILPNLLQAAVDRH